MTVDLSVFVRSVRSLLPKLDSQFYQQELHIVMKIRKIIFICARCKKVRTVRIGPIYRIAAIQAYVQAMLCYTIMASK